MKKLLAALVLIVLLAVNVAATDFVSSIEQKEEPEIGDVSFGEIIVTPISQVDNALYEHISESLTKAREELANNDISDLCPEAFEQIKELYPDATNEDIVVRDLFDVTMTGEYYDLFYSLPKEEAELNITFNCKLTDEEPTPVIMYKQYGSDEWVCVPKDDIVRHENNTITVTFYQVYGPIAFLALPASIIIDDPTHESPDTGDTLAISAAVAAVALAGVAIVIKKKKED